MAGNLIPKQLAIYYLAVFNRPKESVKYLLNSSNIPVCATSATAGRLIVIGWFLKECFENPGVSFNS
jgi:hypothetical protein